MKGSMRKFAPIGLYLAVLAALTAGGLYIVRQKFDLYVQIALGVIVIGLALYAMLDPQRVRENLTGRQARYGSNSLILVLAFLGILIVVNVLVNSSSKRWDLTADQQHTLAQETLATLQKLPDKVTAVGYFTRNNSTLTARNLLDEYKRNSGGKFEYTFIDPSANPVAAQEDKITKDGTIVLKMKDQKELVTQVDEQNLDTGLIHLIHPGERVVYFLTGHGEADPDDSSEKGYSEVKSALTAKNYTVKALNLLTSPKIPTDAKAIVIAGPEKPLEDNEVKLLDAYLSSGGSLVALLEPPLVVKNTNPAADPLEIYLAKTWNVQLKNDLVIDTNANPETIAIANEYGSHAITDTLNNQHMVTVFPTARSVQVDSQSALNPTVLIKTSQQSWAETDLTALQNGQVSFDSSTDLVGPIPLAVAMENSEKKSRIVVVGDSDFAKNANYNAYGNGDLFTSIVDWSAKQDSLITLTAKKQTTRFMLPPQQYSLGLVLLGSVFIIPGIILISGISVWVSRRRKG